ncbi:MAG: IPTL-CTERM sorting domain-containing protein, partial [Dokdonella sp.]
FRVSTNLLTSNIPALTGLASLRALEIYDNQLSGPIPALAGLTELRDVLIYNNQLSGSIPALTGLSNLREFSINNNQLTGSIPSLADASQLDLLQVENNQLTGTVPTAPPDLAPGESSLCPNLLTPTPDPAWDAATGQTPWSFLCNGSGVNFTVTPSAGINGSISPNTPQSVASGSTAVFTVIPAVDYAIAAVEGTCGGTLNGNVYTTNVIVADCTVIASFSLSPGTPLIVTPSAGAYGSITPSTPQSIASGNVATFTIIPGAGAVIAGVGGTCGGTLVANTYTTTAIRSDCTVAASFALLPVGAPVTALPTLSQWALLLLVLFMLAFGAMRASHRGRAR